MKPVMKHIVIACALAATGFAAMAQKPADPSTDHPMMEHGSRMERMQHRDPAKMEAMIAKRSAELKAKLKITPAQEGAWNTYVASLKPTMPPKDTNERATLEGLSTPERIDKMRAMRTQHMADMTAAMDKRDEATKALYATLSPEQKKIFDAHHQRNMRHMKH